VALVTTDVSENVWYRVPDFTPMKEAENFSESADLKRPIRRHPQKITFFIVTTVGNLKSYVALIGWEL
jgi:hypothetical protein